MRFRLLLLKLASSLEMMLKLFGLSLIAKTVRDERAYLSAEELNGKR